MRPRACIWLIAAAIVLLAAFTFFPALDLDISAAFYVPGQGFPWRTSAIGTFVRHDVPPLLLASVAGCVVLWLFGLWRRQTLLGLTTRKILYLVASLTVGPGLIVETLLKPHSGRARPQDLAIFGGSADYTSPLWPSNACAANCSFVSGHAAVAFWITAYAFIVPPAQRTVWLLGGILLGIAVGTVRVMQGAHFPSDIAYAGALVLAVNVMLARLILGSKSEGHGRPAA